MRLSNLVPTSRRYWKLVIGKKDVVSGRNPESKMSNPRVFQLQAAVQQYAWGKLGDQSTVAELAREGQTGFTVDPAAPYAELWMGTHPKAPSIVAHSGQSLSDWLKQNPSCVGEKVRQRFPNPGQLPFLFKVLSVNKALSIQAHPSKGHAEQLHKDKPDKYPDDNHKPEMAIALTDFMGLCGFRPKEEIVNFMKNVPEFCNIIGTSLVEELAQSSNHSRTADILEKCFTALMMCDPALVKEKLTSLVQRLRDMKSRGEDTAPALGDLLLHLDGQFPGDVGCFVVYFLNVMRLRPGEAMFLEANLPHAYLEGDCIECMACSDNVVRAGLTPKFKDVPVLCSMLNYTCKPAIENRFEEQSHPTDCCTSVFNPPVPDFAVDKICLHGTRSYTLPPVDSGSILLVIQGQAQGHSPTLGDSPLPVQRGSVLFVSAGEMLDMDITSEELLMFRAYCPL